MNVNRKCKGIGANATRFVRCADADGAATAAAAATSAAAVWYYIGKALQFNARAKPLKFMANTPKRQYACYELRDIDVAVKMWRSKTDEWEWWWWLWQRRIRMQERRCTVTHNLNIK